jgi:hypothetical protein
MSNIFIILIIILIAVVFVLKKNTNKLSIPLKYKKYLVILYCTILALSTIVLYFIPKNNLISVKKPTEPISKVLRELASQDKLNTSTGLTQKGTFIFDYSGKTLKISGSSINIEFICKRKNIDDGKIEAANYVGDFSYHGFDIPDKVNPPSMKLIKNELLLSDNNSKIDIKINNFTLDFTMNQFIKDENYETMPLFPMKIVYLKIPKSLQIDNTSCNTFQMLN